MPFEPGLSRSWYIKGRVAARTGKWADMYDRSMNRKWFPVKQGGKTIAWIEMVWAPALKKWVTIPGSTRYREVKNPAIPSHWTPVSITRKGKQVQIKTRGR